jgi:hypothetical protein
VAPSSSIRSCVAVADCARIPFAVAPRGTNYFCDDLN